MPEVLGNKLELASEETPGLPVSVKFNQLPGYSVRIMEDLSLSEINRLEIEQSEYCALAIMYRFLEFSNMNKITSNEIVRGIIKIKGE